MEMWLSVYGGFTAADGWVYGRRLVRIIVVDKLMERGGGSVAVRELTG